MVERKTDSQPSAREQAHAELLREALERPGIREVMRVYEHWHHVDRGLEPYRTATREPQRITTTDHANQG